MGEARDAGPGCGGALVGGRERALELADNAARHAATPYMVTLSAAPAVVTVEVQDQSPRLPVMRPLRMVLEHGWEHGRGLHIVDWLADDWGTTLLGDAGKAVWARVHLAA